MNIVDMSNEELKNEVIDINKKQLKNIKRSSLLNIINSLNASRKLLKTNEVLGKKENKNAREEIYSIILELEELLFHEDIDRIYKIRKDLYSKKNILEGYMVEISYMGEIVDECGVKILSNTNEYKKFKGPAIEELKRLIQKSLEESQNDYNKYIFIISEIIKILPMNIVKSNYYDIIRETLFRNFKDYNKPVVDRAIDSYKKQFDSSTRDGYGMEFDNYFMEIQKIKRKDLSSMDLKELSEIVEKIIEITKELTILRDLVLSLGIMVNLLIVISKSKGIDIDKKDTLEAWKESRNEEKSLENFNKSIKKEIGSIDISVQKDLEKYEKLTIELSQRKDFEDESLESFLMETRNVLVYYNDINFSDIEFLETFDMNQVDKNYLELSIESLIDYMEISITGMSNMERKVRMRKLLSLLELPFKNMNEFMDYIGYCLNERVLDRQIINFKTNQIVYFLNEIKYK